MKEVQTVYADTSFLVAWKFCGDKFHHAALSYYLDHYELCWLWSPWHRVEVFNALRQYSLTPEMSGADAKAIIHSLEKDVRSGLLEHVEQDWRDVLHRAELISSQHGFSFPCRAADLLHIAYAVEFNADIFVSFDDDQIQVARAAMLTVENPLRL